MLEHLRRDTYTLHVIQSTTTYPRQEQTWANTNTIYQLFIPILQIKASNIDYTYRDTRLFISLSHIQADSNFHQTLILPVIHSANTDRSLENIRSYRHTLLVVNSINSNPCLEQLRQHAQKIPVIHCTTTHRSLKHVRPHTQAYHINCTTTHPSLELHRRHTQKIPVIHMTTTRPR